MNSKPIGILDSGVGGLSVWKEVTALLPHESIVYIADSKNTPYGGREQEEIMQLAIRMIDFLLKKQVKLIIVACNTITVSGIDTLRKEYPGVPLIGTVPVIKTAATVSKNRKIGIFSTTRTAESRYQKELIQKFAQDCEVLSIGSDDLVPLIEQGIIEGNEIREVLKNALLPLRQNKIDTLAVACTHYPFIEKEIRAVLGEGVSLLEPSAAVARHTKRILEKNKTLTDAKDSTYRFYTTGEKELFQSVAKNLLGITIQAEHIDL